MIKKAIAILLLIAAVYWSFSALLPSKISNIDTDKNQFSTARALVHLEAISQQPHAVGAPAHEIVRDYIVQQLENLGLNVQIQEGFSMTSWGALAKPKNILARIKGSEPGKALMVLSHYDSAPHSSFGASDAGSGVVTILEGLRAFLHDGKTPKNDIIVLFTDAEELGLNGADLFVNKHPWTKDLGLVLNFEARGSGGPSYMLIETNGGNSKLMKGFVKANPKFPVANSLAYSIYKMLPNDTDLTRFRADADINGFNFAFIDDHYDYHTANDTYERLDRETLEHQGSYIMPMLNYFSQANLSNLKSEDDYIYFNAPVVKTVTYPFSWIWPMLIFAIALFVFLMFYGIKKGRLNKEDALKGFSPILLSVLVVLVIGYILWEFIKLINPHYAEMLHGFTYNGHTYIFAFAIIALGICFWIYSRYYKPGNTASLTIAPIFIWLVICILMSLKLKGASFFIIPVYFGLLALFVLINQRKPSLIVMAIISFPMLLIMSPFVKMFPVGLGFFMNIGFATISVKLVSMLLITLMFGLLVPIFGFFKHKRRWSYVLLFIGFCSLISAQFNSKFTAENPKPNSLVYFLDADTNEALWATYDEVLDDWTKTYLGDDPNNAQEIASNIVGSKYNSSFTYVKKAPIEALVHPTVEIDKDTIIDGLRNISVYVQSNREANRMEVFADATNQFTNFKVNGLHLEKDDEGFILSRRWSNRLFGYFVSNNEPLLIEFTTPIEQETVLTLYESTNDLMTNRFLEVNKRGDAMITKPFILNDAIIIKKKISIQ